MNEKIKELKEKLQKELHRNPDDLYWQTMSELLYIVEMQQRAIDWITTFREELDGPREYVNHSSTKS